MLQLYTEERKRQELDEAVLIDVDEGSSRQVDHLSPRHTCHRQMPFWGMNLATQRTYVRMRLREQHCYKSIKEYSAEIHLNSCINNLYRKPAHTVLSHLYFLVPNLEKSVKPLRSGRVVKKIDGLPQLPYECSPASTYT